MALPAKPSYLMGGTFNSVAPILIDGDTSPFQLDASGNLKVTFTGGSASNPAAGPTGSPVPGDASYTGVNVGGILEGVTGFSVGSSIPMAVAIVDGSGNQITSFGGGSQFAMGSAQSSSALGTIALGYDGTNVRGLLTSSTGQLHVIIDSATLGTVAVTFPASPVVWIKGSAGVVLDSAAGTPNGQAVTIQGNASGVPVPVSGTVSVTNFANPLPVSQSGLWNVNQAIGVAGFEKITDGTNGPVAVKVSAQPGATDPALVAVLSPTTPLYAQQWGTPSGVTSQIALSAFSLDGGGKNALTVALVDNNGNQIGYSISAPIVAATTGFNGLGQALVTVNSSSLNNALDENILSIRGTLPTQAGYLDVKISDGTNGTAAVKPASTAPLATDPALVVTISPNSGNVGVVGTTTDGTTAETNFLVVGGESNDATAQYQPVPLGPGGRSVIIEGFTGGIAVPVSGSISASGTVTANQGTPNILANAWPHVITDGVNGPVAVKSGNVIPSLSDSALVVTISPNSQDNRGLMDLVQTLILEVRAMRTALVYSVTENGDVSDRDFDPASADFSRLINGV